MYVIDTGHARKCEHIVGQSVDGAPKLVSLHPTNGAFNDNVVRTHLQVAVWMNALQPDPPAIEPIASGWSLEEGSKTSISTTLPSDTPLAPDALPKLVRCSCSSETPCKTEMRFHFIFRMTDCVVGVLIYAISIYRE